MQLKVSNLKTTAQIWCWTQSPNKSTTDTPHEQSSKENVHTKRKTFVRSSDSITQKAESISHPSMLNACRPTLQPSASLKS